MVVIRVVSAPKAAVEADAVKAVETTMADKVAATKTANGEPVTTEPVATEAMAAAETVATATMTTAAVAATTVTSTTAGVGDLGQRHEPGNEHCKHQIEQLTTHDTLLCRRFSPVAIDVLG
jgi:hypothetical protein